jgi:hypothetical protein
MNTKKNTFSLSEAENEALCNKQDKIEVVSCPRKKLICKDQLAFINQSYVLSEQYFKDKEFVLSIDYMLDAFNKTKELTDSPCAKCATVFRSTITESMLKMHNDLKKMSSGFFGKKSYKPSCEKAAKVLEEFEKVSLQETLKSEKLKSRFIGDFIDKQVS